MLVVLENNSEASWILDSGCSYYMTPHKSWLHDYKDGEQGMVRLQNNKGCKMMRSGLVRLRTEKDGEVELTGVTGKSVCIFIFQVLFKI